MYFLKMDDVLFRKSVVVGESVCAVDVYVTSLNSLVLFVIFALEM